MSNQAPISTPIPQRQGIRYRSGEVAEVIRVKSTVRDTGQPLDTALRGGMVLVEESPGGDFIRADDAAAPGGAPAEVKALEAADADWAERTLSFKVNHGLTVAVVLGANDDTNAEVVAALNADVDFAAELFADIDGGVVRVRTLKGGPNAHILATDNEDNSAFGANGVEGVGGYPKFAVLKNTIDMLADGAAADQNTVGLTKSAHFIEADLIGLTELAKAALRAEDCLFD